MRIKRGNATCQSALHAQGDAEHGGAVALQHTQQLRVLALPHSDAAVAMSSDHEVQCRNGVEGSDCSLCLAPQDEHLRLGLDVPGNQPLTCC